MALPGILPTKWNNSMANPSATNNYTYPLIDELKPLSWQNAFWSLTALALNAMAQVSTADGNDAEIAFSLWRSSPLICFVEIIVMIMWAVVGWYHGNTLRDCLSLSRQCILSVKKRSFDANRPSNFMTLIFWVLVPLPQILKIIASTGIYWTKAWAMAFFLVSVLTFPVVEQRSDLDIWRLPKSTEIKLVRMSHHLYKLSLAIYVTLWIILVGWTTWWLMSSLILSGLWWFWLPLALLAILYGILVLPTGLAVCGSMLIDIITRCTYSLRGEQFTSIVWSNQWMEKVVEPGLWNQSVLWGLEFAFWHLIAGLVWYSSFYNESGTTKPSWAEKLG